LRQRISFFIFFGGLASLLSLIFIWRGLGEPNYNDEVVGLPGSSKASVHFDKHGIPHIKAQGQKEAFFALGYTMASERLFQMDLLRRLARGKLSEIFGPKTLEVDKLFKTLSLAHHFEEKFRDRPPEGPFYDSMKAFYAGVNLYIKNGAKPREYYLLGSDPVAFKVMDAYAIVGYMAYSFAMGLKTDLLYQEIANDLGGDALNQLRIKPQVQKVRTVKNSLASEQFLADSSFSYAQKWIEENLPVFTGSNAWVLAPKRSQTGGALLANDPHVRLSSPGLWFEAHMDWGGGEIYGHFVPGLPFSALGHNKLLSWGLTISYVDDMDFYREKRKGDQVFFKGKWIKLEKRVEKIIVKGHSPVEHLVEIGPHGPLLDGLSRLKTTPGKSLALKWSHYHPKNDPAKAFYGMMTATSRETFKKALTLGRSPGLNILYADAAGNIGRYLFGGFPIRPSGMTGDLIYPGDDARYEIEGELEFFERPHLENPESGVIVSANQRPEAPGDSIKGYYQPDDRYTSLHQILAGKEKWSLEELKYVQTANVNIFNNVFKKRLLSQLSPEDLDGSYLEAFATLKAWDGTSVKESAGSLLFHQIFFELERNLLAPRFSKYYLRLCELTSFWHGTKNKILTEDIKVEVEKSFKQAVEILKNKYGAINNWNWGEAHFVEFSHPLGEASKLLAMIFNYGPYPLDGGFNHVNNLRRLGCQKAFQVQVGPSTRRLIDMSNPSESYGILPMGNSAHLYGEFYSNQFDLFSKGRFRSQSLGLEKQDIYATTVFKPSAVK